MLQSLQFKEAVVIQGAGGVIMPVTVPPATNYALLTKPQRLNMAVRTSQATWKGNLREGTGTFKVGTAFEGSYSFPSRFEEGTGTNPEELIGAAHASCFSMAFSNGLDKAGFTPERVDTTAHVHLTKSDAGFSISKIELHTEATVPGIDEDTFQEQANDAKENCPVSKLLSAAEITLDAKLVS